MTSMKKRAKTIPTVPTFSSSVKDADLSKSIGKENASPSIVSNDTTLPTKPIHSETAGLTVLESVTLENFKRHKSLTVNFSEQLTAIVGPNYSGKSSVLEGVFFALFGAKAVPGGTEIITRTGSRSKACVTLRLRIAGRDFKVVRTPTTAVLSRVSGPEEEVVATGHTAVTEEIAKRFGGDMKRTMMLSFSSQGETSALLTMGAAKLNQIIEDVSGIDYIDKLIALATKKSSDASAVLDSMGEVENVEELDQAVDIARTQQKECEARKQANDKLYESSKKELEEINKQLDEASNHNKKAERSNKARQQLLSDLNAASENLKASKLELSKMETPDVAAIEQDWHEKANKAEKLAEKKSALVNIEHKLDQKTVWLDEVGDKYISWAENLPLVEEQKKIVGAAQQYKDEMLLLESESKKLYLSLKNDLQNSVCSACNRAFDEEHLKKVQTQIPEAKENWELHKQCLSDAEKKLNIAKQTLSTLQKKLPPEDWEKQIADCKESISSLTKEKNEIEFRPEFLDKAKAELSEAQQRLSDATAKQRERARMERTVENQTKRVAEVKAELDMTKEVVMTDLQPLLAAQTEKMLAHGDYSNARAELTAEYEAARHQTQALELRLKTAAQLASKRATAEATKARFGQFARWLRDNKAAFLSDTWAGILAMVSEFVSSVTSGRVQEIGRDPDGDFWFREGDEQRPIAAASGGQKSIAGAGLRIALASLLPASLNFVVLDEPSADLNTEHAASLAGALRATGRQVILVTHREGEEFSSDAVVTLE